MCSEKKLNEIQRYIDSLHSEYLKNDIRSLINEVKEYRQAQKGGLVLPCKIGTTVYQLITHSCTPSWGIRQHIEMIPFEYSMLKDWGKTIFPSYEGARDHMEMGDGGR